MTQNFSVYSCKTLYRNITIFKSGANERPLIRVMCKESSSFVLRLKLSRFYRATRTPAHSHPQMYTRMHAHTRARTHIHVLTQVGLQTPIYNHKHTHTHMDMRTNIRTCTRAYTETVIALYLMSICMYMYVCLIHLLSVLLSYCLS